MAVRISIDDAHGMVVARATGQLSSREIIGAFSATIEETRGKIMGKDVLFVCAKDVSFHHIDLQALHEIRNSMESWRKIYPTKRHSVACVVPATLSQATAKLWKSITETSGFEITVGLFEKEEDAAAWFTVQRAKRAEMGEGSV